MFDLTGKVALITGGAHSIGFAMGVCHAKAGATVCFNCTSEASRNRGIANYAKEGITAYGCVANVTKEYETNELVAKIKAEHGVIDILVNNAGIIKRIPMLEMAVEDFKQVIDVDLVVPFICAKAVLPDMIAKDHGKIINVCSIMSELGRETVSTYAAAQGGLKMLTRSICSEYGQENIQCNGIATQQTAPLRERQADGSRHPFDQFIVAKPPAGRWGNPEDPHSAGPFSN